MKKTRIAALEGRVIEKVTIFHDDGNENPVSMEIRCLGGLYFDLSLVAEVTVKAVSILASNRTGSLQNQRKRTFKAVGTMPYGEDCE